MFQVKHAHIQGCWNTDWCPTKDEDPSINPLPNHAGAVLVTTTLILKCEAVLQMILTENGRGGVGKMKGLPKGVAS